MYLTEFIQEGVKNVPLRKTHTQQKLATLMGMSKPTVHHWIVASTIHVHCNSLKPILTEENKLARVKMALYFRDAEDPTKYQDMCGIHLDEKWFFLSWEKERPLLLLEEKNPKCCVKLQSHITKVCSCVLLQGLNITLVQNLGGMASWVFGLLGIGNQLNKDQRTDLRGHWCGRTKQ